MGSGACAETFEPGRPGLPRATPPLKRAARSSVVIRFRALTMTAIQIRRTAEEPGAASLAVTVPVEQVREAEERATSAYQRRARLPGFRRGKAPAALVKKQFADDIRQQALEEMIRTSWKAALAPEALKPIAAPHIHNLKCHPRPPVPFESHSAL